ncbi:MAG TPA: hypothetical protein VES42_23455 [Pilimelia sp.]|nr:hypothetical protein [Pilimelia sp.]
MMRSIRAVALLLAAAVAGAGLVAAPAQAAPPASLCPGGQGSSRQLTYQGVQVHSSLPCQWLDRGQSWTFGNARLTMQTDGNLVIYDRSNRARWASNTQGRGATQLLFQHDGNLVLYRSGYSGAVWASNTRHTCGAWATTIGLQADSNFVIYCRLYNGSTFQMYPIWATGTRF